MTKPGVDLIIVGAGPVGLLAAILARKLDMTVEIFDKKSEPLQLGRADALNARTLQLLNHLNLLDPLWKRGQPCNTSSTFANGRFQSRNSEWWEALEGCEKKCFLMIGQAHIEQHFHQILRTQLQTEVRWNAEITDIRIQQHGPSISATVKCNSQNTQGGGETMEFDSRFLLGADGAHSFVRKFMQIPFHTHSLPITWAVLDGEIESDFPKCPEIIVFQQSTADVAWIPREWPIDRFYVRMDRLDFTQKEAVDCIKSAMKPYNFEFKSVHWFSQFTGTIYSTIMMMMNPLKSVILVSSYSSHFSS